MESVGRVVKSVRSVSRSVSDFLEISALCVNIVLYKEYNMHVIEPCNIYSDSLQDNA